MKTFVGGLFQTKETTYEAYQALQQAGFDQDDMKILSLKRSEVHPYREGVSIKSVAIYALIGAVIGTAVAAFLGFLIGQGVIDIPAFIPVSNLFFTLNTFGLFLSQGAVTGAILGVITRLAMAREKPAFTESGVRHGGVVLAVNTKENEQSAAKEEMKKAGAYDLVNLSETWDQEAWSEFKELQPPSEVS